MPKADGNLHHGGAGRSRAATVARSFKKPKASDKIARRPKRKGAGSLQLGSGWRLSVDGGKTEFYGTLLMCHDTGDKYLAVMKVSG